MTDTAIAYYLAALTRDTWHVIATSDAPGSWQWHLTGTEVGELVHGREIGRFVTMLKRTGDGVYELWARVGVVAKGRRT